MKHINYFIAPLVLILALAGCNSNYKYSDADYRPLGEPTTVNRSN